MSVKNRIIAAAAEYGLYNLDCADLRADFDKIMQNNKLYLPEITEHKTGYIWRYGTKSFDIGKAKGKTITGGSNSIRNGTIAGVRVIVRTSRNSDLFYSYKENIKTILLYIYSKVILNIKIMPKLYYFIMKYYEQNAASFIADNIDDIPVINGLLVKIYGTLAKLCHINFRHGDFNCYNVMLYKNNIILIDFGHSSFILPGFEHYYTGIEALYDDMYQFLHVMATSFLHHDPKLIKNYAIDDIITGTNFYNYNYNYKIEY